MYISPKRTPAVARRQDIEIRIIKATVHALLEAGFTLSVFDGEEHLLVSTGSTHGSANSKAIFDALYNTDEDYLNVWKDNKKFGWVRFVYGNDGWDVICDYDSNLDPFIGEGSKVQQLIDKASE